MTSLWRPSNPIHRSPQHSEPWAIGRGFRAGAPRLVHPIVTRAFWSPRAGLRQAVNPNCTPRMA